MKTRAPPDPAHHFFIFIRYTFHALNHPISSAFGKRFQSFIDAFLIDETFPINTILMKPLPQKPDLSRVSSYRIAPVRQRVRPLSCPHDTHMKQKRANRAAIAPSRPCAS
ncbi:hypothetical protein LGN17_08020 [Burkholderia sp. AU30280]|uniref:hypothetical protein n=1 Tax=Burkholderia sp. AU30280 TaxID=2879628 RepID=UPI001CF5E1E4|nr:hypothetical protein [Burkholderia sp. AU30280]MCA8272458.1 hypothetical protein [Burkholderia sp. AU30280]